MSVLLTICRVSAVGPVVAHEPLRGLERDRGRHPLARVVLRLDQDAGLAAVAMPADAQGADRVRAARHLARGRAGALLVEEVGQRHRRQRRLDDARAVVGPVRVRAVDQPLGLRPSAAATSATVLVSSPEAPLASSTRTALPSTSTVERPVGPAALHELDGDVVPALVAPRRRADHHRLCRDAAERRLRLALVAVGPVRQPDDLGDVRVLPGDLLEARRRAAAGACSRRRSPTRSPGRRSGARRPRASPRRSRWRRRRCCS